MTALTKLAHTNFEVISIEASILFERLSANSFAFDPIETDDWLQLLESTCDASSVVYVIDCATMKEDEADESGLRALTLSALMQNQMPVRSLRWFALHRGQPGGAAVASLGRVIAREQACHHLASIEVLGNILSGCSLIFSEVMHGSAHAVCIDHNQRKIRQWLPAKSSGSMGVRQEGCYLITGGLGALGLAFAAHLKAAYPGVRIILVGRNLPDASASKKILALGDSVLILHADIADLESLDQALTHARSRFGPISGVIHAAGIMQDGLSCHVTPHNFEVVTRPKILGSRNIDLLTRDDSLDWFVSFSTVVGELGNVGQSAYAYACAWQDAFARKRSAIAGKSISILWPYWSGGGFQASADSILRFKNNYGFEPISIAAGVRAFERALTCSASEVLVSAGEGAIILRNLNGQQTAAKTLNEKRADPVPRTFENLAKASHSLGPSVRDQVIAHLRLAIAKVLGCPVDSVQMDKRFEALGIDSLSVLSLVESLEDAFGTLSYAIFYKFDSISGLADELIDKGFVPPAFTTAALPRAVTESAHVPAKSTLDMNIIGSERNSGKLFPTPMMREQDIAIIGLAGRFPDSDDINVFWEQLASGQDLIRELPKDHFGSSVFVDSNNTANKDKRWGGFLDQIDMFDPLFFKLSPKEACLLG